MPSNLNSPVIAKLGEALELMNKTCWLVYETGGVMSSVGDTLKSAVVETHLVKLSENSGKLLLSPVDGEVI